MLDLKSTAATTMLRDKNREPEVLLARHVPYIAHITDTVIMLRDGDLMASFEVQGINADTAEETYVSDIAHALSHLVAQQHGDVGFYIHRISALTEPKLDSVMEEGFMQNVDRIWQHYIQKVGLRDRTAMVTLTMRPNKASGLKSKIMGESEGQQREHVEQRAKKLDKLISNFMETLGPAKPKRLSVSSGKWLGLLRTLTDGHYQPLTSGVVFRPLTDIVCNSDIVFHGDMFTVYGGTENKTRVGSIITIKDYPAATYAGMFDRLNLPYDTVVTHSFTPTDTVSAQRHISLVRRQMQAADDAAVSLRMQLEEAEDDAASGRSAFGYHHATVCVFCEDEEELDTAVTFISRAIQEVGGSMVRENFAARAAFFAQHPGNYAYRTRPATISSLNFAEMAALHGSSEGRVKEKSPWGEAITILPTARGEPYRFNFHLAGSYNERTVGHSLILGQTGSGKTLGTAFLVAQAARVKPRVIVFDKDNGFEMALRAMGGSYSPVKMGEPTGFNPFRAESDERGSAWLANWITNLVSKDGAPLNAVQIEAIGYAVQANTLASPSLQNFADFHSQFRATDDEGDLHTRLSRWDEDGQFGWLFNGKEDDPLAFNNDIVGFDLTEIFDDDLVRTAWLSYVFRRIERLVADERPTLLVLDEAWKLLDDPYFEARLKDWMLTLRKKNVALILLTQRVSHIKESAAGNSILESAVTRLVYPSSFNTEEELAPLNLTSNEQGFLQTSNVGNHMALLKSGEDSVVLDLDLSVLGGGIDVLGGGAGKKARAGWHEDPDFWKEYF